LLEPYGFVAIDQLENSNSPLSFCLGENSMVIDKNRMHKFLLKQ